jgi:hypothetical protein
MSSPSDDRPPPRDPLLDDPLFAEIVGPAAPKAAEPLYAEPVEPTAAEELPVAPLAPVQPRPKAVPVAGKAKPQITLPPPPPETEPPRPQWFAACGVMGCLGGLVILAVAALIWIAITLLSNLGEKISQSRDNGGGDSLPVLIQPGPIAPTALAADLDLPLEGNVDAVCCGGNGRLLIMRMPSRRELAVFDANQAEVALRVPIRDGNALFAAGASKLFIYTPMDRKLTRINLSTGAVEKEEGVSPQLRVIEALAMGPGSNGPLYAVTKDVPRGNAILHTFNSETLNSPGYATLSTGLIRDDVTRVRASHDGKLLGISCRDGAVAVQIKPDGTFAARPLKPKGTIKPEWATPSPDDEFLYSPRGIYLPNGDPYDQTDRGYFCFPTAHPSKYYVRIPLLGVNVDGSPKLYKEGEKKADAVLTVESVTVDGAMEHNTLRALALTPDDRVHVWPAAGLLAYIAPTGQKLMLRKFPVIGK